MKSAIVAAVVAAVVAAASGTAATIVITSKNIKNGTIQTVDISAKAKRALKGNRGPRGFAGPTGAQGPFGSKGEKGEKGDPSAIAYGIINASGSVSQATPNVTSAWNAALSRYEITIAGVDYHFSGYATTVTSADPAQGLMPATNSLGGKLVIYFRNTLGTALQTSFGFVTYDP
jgi:hypothetical protein